MIMTEYVNQDLFFCTGNIYFIHTPYGRNKTSTFILLFLKNVHGGKTVLKKVKAEEKGKDRLSVLPHAGYGPEYHPF